MTMDAEVSWVRVGGSQGAGDSGVGAQGTSLASHTSEWPVVGSRSNTHY